MHLNMINPIMCTLKPHSNVTGTLAVNGWAVTFGKARRGLGGLWLHPVPSWLHQPTHQRPVYQLHIIRCGTIITFAL